MGVLLLFGDRIGQGVGVFVDVDRQGGHGTVKGQVDVLVVFGGGLVIDDGRCGHLGLQ